MGKSCLKSHWGQVEKKGAEKLGSLLKTRSQLGLKLGAGQGLPVLGFGPVWRLLSSKPSCSHEGSRCRSFLVLLPLTWVKEERSDLE